MTESATGEAELFIHLDIDGLAALMKAVEAAMTDGSGRLCLRGGSGMIVAGGGAPDRFGTVTVTFADRPGPSDDAGWTGRPDPERDARVPVLEMQS